MSALNGISLQGGGGGLGLKVKDILLEMLKTGHC